MIGRNDWVGYLTFNVSLNLKSNIQNSKTDLEI